MEKFVKEEVWPLEVIDTDLAGFTRLLRPLQDEVKARGLWATHLPPEHCGQGYGQDNRHLMHEIAGSTRCGPTFFGNPAPGSCQSEILAMYSNAEQRKKTLARVLT